MKALNDASLSCLLAGDPIVHEGKHIGHLVDVTHLEGKTEIAMALDDHLDEGHDEGAFAHLAVLTRHGQFEFNVHTHVLKRLAPGATVRLTLVVAALVAHDSHQEWGHRRSTQHGV